MRPQLSPAMKKLVWAPITSNLGVGWESPVGRPRDPRAVEEGGTRVKPTLPLDNIETEARKLL